MADCCFFGALTIPCISRWQSGKSAAGQRSARVGSLSVEIGEGYNACEQAGGPEQIKGALDVYAHEQAAATCQRDSESWKQDHASISLSLSIIRGWFKLIFPHIAVGYAATSLRCPTFMRTQNFCSSIIRIAPTVLAEQPPGVRFFVSYSCAPALGAHSSIALTGHSSKQHLPH